MTMQRKRPACAGLFLIQSPRSRRRDVFGLQALLAVDDLEADLLAFLQAFETRTTDGAEMHKHVRATLPADEAETLGVVEPLDGTYFTIRHDSLRSIPDAETNRPQRAEAYWACWGGV